MKPDNILFDDDGNAFITDFGIATARFHGRLTASGRAMGTPHYMSPEQAMGKLVDGRSDLYALGVVMYEALVGFPPFDGADAFSVGYKHVHEKPVNLAEIDSRLPPAMVEVVMRCLNKPVDERYARGDELADALLDFLATSEDATAPRARRRACPPPRPLGTRMKLTHEIISLRTKNPFVIARGGDSEYRVVRVTVTAPDGSTGWGEAAPSKFYGETADTVVNVLPLLADALQGMDGWSLEGDGACAGAHHSLQWLGARRRERGAARSRGQAARRAAVQAVGTRSRGVAADELHDRHRAG